MTADPTRTATGDGDTAGDGGAGGALELGELGALGGSLGRYAIVERIGAGGMGVVYRARDPALDRELAIKVVRAGRGGRRGPAR